MRRDSTFDSAIWILVILFCPLLVIFPLLAIVWILAPYFIEQWKEDWRAARERERKLKSNASSTRSRTPSAGPPHGR